MNNNLLLNPENQLMERLTQISGNVSIDKVTPSIWISQVTEIKRILTDKLYNKILTDFLNNTLTGDYLIIYDEYVSIMLVFFSTADFIMRNSTMVSNGGNFQNLPTNSQISTSKENERLSKHYRDLGAHFEMQFYAFMKDKNITEYERVNEIVKTFIFGWDI